MGKQLQLTIPTPCHKSWDLMTPSEKGKFCSSCQKQVVDFSRMNDRQVAEFFKKPSTGSVCGRFMADQLDRAIDIPKKRIPWFKYFFQFALPAFIFSSKAVAQGYVTTKIVSTKTKKPSVKPFKKSIPPTDRICSQGIMGDIEMFVPKEMLKPVADASLVIEGKVLDVDGNPLIHASVLIKNTRIGVATDENGSFKIKLDKDWKEVQLVVSYVGFETTERAIEISENTQGDKITIVLFAQQIEEMGIIIVRHFNTKNNTAVPLMPIVKDTTAAQFRTFPNPVRNREKLNIELTGAATGEYTIQLMTFSGQLIYSSAKRFDEKIKKADIIFPSCPPGFYFIILTNKKTRKEFTEKIIVQ